MAEDIKVGDRVRVDGEIPGVCEADGVCGYVEQVGGCNSLVAFDRPVGSGMSWWIYNAQATKVKDPIGPEQVTHCHCGRAEPCRHHPTAPSAPLAILARAAEEVLTYHVPVEADDDEGIECWGVDGGWLTVGNLRGLVRQGKREGVL